MRECLALVADASLSGERFSRELDLFGEHRGFPMMIVSDNVLYQEARIRFGNTSPSAVWTVVEKYRKQKPRGLHRKKGAPGHSKHRVQNGVMAPWL